MRVRALEGTNLKILGVATSRTLVLDMDARAVVAVLDDRTSPLLWRGRGMLLDDGRMLLQQGAECRVLDSTTGEVLEFIALEDEGPEGENALGFVDDRLVANRYGRLRLLEHGREVACLDGKVFRTWCPRGALFRVLPVGYEGATAEVLVEYDRELHERWRRAVPAGRKSSLAVYRRVVPIDGTLAVALVGDAGGSTLLWGVDRESGDLRWEREVATATSFLVSRSEVHVGCKDQFLRLNANTGELLSQVPLEGAGSVMAVPVDAGVLAISTDDRRLRLFDRAGQLSQEFATPDWRPNTAAGAAWDGNKVACIATGMDRGIEFVLTIDIDAADGASRVPGPGYDIQRTVSGDESTYRLRVHPGSLYDATRVVRVQLRNLAYRHGLEGDFNVFPEVDRAHRGLVQVEFVDPLGEEERAIVAAVLQVEEKWVKDLWLHPGGGGKYRFDLA